MKTTQQPARLVIHARIDGRVLCGTRGNVSTVPPHKAMYVTCRRCRASLNATD